MDFKHTAFETNAKGKGAQQCEKGRSPIYLSPPPLLLSTLEGKDMGMISFTYFKPSDVIFFPAHVDEIDLVSVLESRFYNQI